MNVQIDILIERDSSMRNKLPAVTAWLGALQRELEERISLRSRSVAFGVTLIQNREARFMEQSALAFSNGNYFTGDSTEFRKVWEEITLLPHDASGARLGEAWRASLRKFGAGPDTCRIQIGFFDAAPSDLENQDPRDPAHAYYILPAPEAGKEPKQAYLFCLGAKDADYELNADMGLVQISCRNSREFARSGALEKLLSVIEDWGMTESVNRNLM